MTRQAAACTPPAVVVTTVLLFLLLHGACASDIAVVKERWINFLVPSDPTSTIDAADGYLHALLPNGSWPDINYHDMGRSIWSPGNHVARVQTMSTAWHVNNDTALLAGVDKALAFWLAADPQSPNWWWNMIDVPQALSTSALLLGDAVLASQRAALVSRMERAAWWKGGFTAANLVWLVETQIRRGLWTGNSSAVDGGFARLWQEITVTHQGDDGIQHDQSYHQHGAELLAGSYGDTYSSLLLQAVSFAVNTTFAPSQRQAGTLGAFIAGGQAWMTIGQFWDVSVVGREVTRPSFEGAVHLDGLVNLAAVVSNASVADGLRAFAKRLDGGTPDPALTGSRHYYDSDYTVHRTTAWVVSIHMFSNRTVAYRCVNDEAKTSQHMSDGFVGVYRTAGSNPYVDMGALWDYRQLPGVATEQNTPYLPCGYESALNGTAFVGGAVEAGVTGGVTAMNSSANSLVALRSWHAGAAGVTAVGVASCASRNGVDVTLAARLLAGDVHAMVAGASAPVRVPTNATSTFTNATWLHHDDVVYVPPAGGVPVAVYAGARTGNWSTVGTSSGSVARNVFTAVAQLGSHLSHAPFAYTVLPGVPLSSAPAAVAAFHNATALVAATTDVHASHDAAAGVVRAVFWQPGGGSVMVPGVGVVAATQPCMVLVRAANGVAPVVTVSSPLPAVRSVTVSVSYVHASGPGCAVARGGGTAFTATLPTGDALGGSVSVACAATAVATA